MTIDELKLLDTVKDFTDLEGLCQFLNRSQRTIRNALWRIQHKSNKYYYTYFKKEDNECVQAAKIGRIKKHTENSKLPNGQLRK